MREYTTIEEIFRTVQERFPEEEVRIEVVCVQCPSESGEYYYYDPEYSFEGTLEEYREFVKNYFEYGDIEQEFVSYIKHNSRNIDVSILYLKDW